MEGYAEFYSAELSEKVVRGMTENVLKGRNNGGQVTFGYEIDDDMYFHPHPTTAPIVEEIFTMYDDGKTIKQIVDYLEEKNIKTIRGGKMTINIVQRMLSNRRYIGEYKFRDTVIPDGIPALVNKDLFERVQQKLAKNKKAPARRKAEDDYLLTLKLFAGNAGRICSVKAVWELQRFIATTNALKQRRCICAIKARPQGMDGRFSRKESA